MTPPASDKYELEPPPEGFAGTSFVITVERNTIDYKEQDDQERDLMFPTFGSYLVFDAKKIIEQLIDKHKAELTTYNKKLQSVGSPLHVRVVHSSIVKGKKYVYCGRYLYSKHDTGLDKYLGRLDVHVLREELRDLWIKVGAPPTNILDGFRFSVVSNNGKETDHIVVPGDLFNNDKFRHLFEKCTVFRLA